MPGTDADVIDALVGIAPGSALDAIRHRRPEARDAGAGQLSRAVRAGRSRRRHRDGAFRGGRLRHRPARRGGDRGVLRRRPGRQRSLGGIARAIDAAIAAARAQGPYGSYPAGSAEPRGRRRADLSRRAGNPPRAGAAPGRGVRAHAPAGIPPARRRAGGAAGAAGCRLVHHRHRDAVADRRLPVVPDPGGRRFARPGRRP